MILKKQDIFISPDPNKLLTGCVIWWDFLLEENTTVPTYDLILTSPTIVPYVANIKSQPTHVFFKIPKSFLCPRQTALLIV